MTTQAPPGTGTTGGRDAERPGTRRDAARAFGVVVGPSLALDAAALAAVTVTARRLAARRRPPAWAAAGSLAVAVYLGVVRPWMRDLGATHEERRMPLPGDEQVPGPAVQGTRAVGIAAPPERVWPWVAQIGQDRGGFYSWEWAENLAGCRMRNADRIHPEWQHREVGETVYLHWSTGLPVTRFDPPDVIALGGWGAFVVRRAADGGTRLLARNRRPRGPAGLPYVLLIELPHAVMEWAMLRGIRCRAERAERHRAEGVA
jgi:hypothetical protein